MNNRKKIYGYARGALLKCSATVMGVMLMLVLLPGMTSFAETTGKVTASSANIRQSTDAGSTVLGSLKQGDSISINAEVADASGTVWYEVFVNSETKGYIRSDLVQKSDGSAPSANAIQPVTGAGAASGTAGSNVSQPQTPETPAEVTAVQPQSGKVTGSDAVRVRSNASTTSEVVATAKSGVALTVTGQASDAGGKVWYQVNFINDGSEVTGFIRNDYVALDGELVPADQAPADDVGEVPEEQPEAPAETPAETKDMDTRLQEGVWYLVDNINLKQYNIQDMFNAVEENASLYKKSMSTVKSQKIIVIVLVIVVVVLALGVTLLIFKIKDMTDASYFEEVERDTIRSRSPDKKVMQTIGRDSAPAKAGTRAGAQGSRAGAQGSRTAQTGRQSADGRPAAKPASSGGSAPRQQEGRASARPAEGRGARPAEGAKAAGQPGRQSAGRPAQGSRPASSGSRPAARPAASPNKSAEPNPGWKSKNFMTDDDDEFEFEFLNWDGDDEQ